MIKIRLSLIVFFLQYITLFFNIISSLQVKIWIRILVVVAKKWFYCIGYYGIKNRNLKGIEAINLLTMHNLFVSSIFFYYKNYTTWRSFNGKHTLYHLDHWFLNSIDHIKIQMLLNVCLHGGPIVLGLI